MSCAANCVGTIPQSGSGCYPRIQKGGLKYLVFKACDGVLTDYTDLTQWQDLITADKVRLSPIIAGDVPAGAATNEVFNSCSPKSFYLGMTNTLNFESIDYAVDDPNNIAQYVSHEFWNDILANQNSYEFGWFDCNGTFTGFFDGMGFTVSDVRQQDPKTLAKFQGTITWDTALMPAPTIIASGALAALEAAANTP